MAVIYVIWTVIYLLIQLFFVGTLIYEILSVRYFQMVYVNLFTYIGFAAIVIPVVVIIFNCILKKSNSKKVKIFGGIMSVVLEIASVLVALFCMLGIALGGGVASETTDINNYLVVDEFVEELMQTGATPFPSELPENTEKTEYHYSYRPSMDDTTVITLCCEYGDQQTFDTLVKELTQKQYVKTEQQTEYTRYYLSLYGVVSYIDINEKAMTVFYGYYYN